MTNQVQALPGGSKFESQILVAPGRLHKALPDVMTRKPLFYIGVDNVDNVDNLFLVDS